VSYALKRFGTRLVVVLGHSHDAVAHAALEGVKDGAAGRLVADIAPAVEQARNRVADLSGSDLEASVVEHNVLLEMERILKNKTVGDKVRDGRVKVIGGIYNLDTGQVRWLGEHPQQDQILAGKRP
ncbi:MAG: carbonic anhydrase, partial [bacterium]